MRNLKYQSARAVEVTLKIPSAGSFIFGKKKMSFQVSTRPVEKEDAQSIGLRNSACKQNA